MAASNGSPPGQQPRVPAWKRLGLKLKYAKEDAEHDSPEATNRITTSIGNKSHQQNDNDDSRPSKKRRTNSDHLEKPQQSVANSSTEAVGVRKEESPKIGALEVTAEPGVEDRSRELESVNHSQSKVSGASNHTQIEETSVEARQKSVTFTTDTKQEDSVGAPTSSKRRTPEQASTTKDSIASASVLSPKETKKRQKRAKKTKIQAEASSSTPRGADEGEQVLSVVIPECVNYLQLFYTDKPSWKFNKNKQNDLLKNLFHIDRIPPEHNTAIQQYIAGLQGSAARQRVVEGATTVLKEIAEKEDGSGVVEEMESEEARRTAYSNALRRHLKRYESAKAGENEYDDQQIEEMRREAERGNRAEAVLGELLRKELYPDQESRLATQPLQTAMSNPGASSTSMSPVTITSRSATTTTSKRKKRKTRTQAAGEDSNSDTSKSEGPSNPKRGPSTVRDALEVRPDPTPKFSAKTSSLPKATGTRKIFDDDFLDQVFPKKPSYHETAPKRKAGEKRKVRGFAYTHGTRADESGSEDEYGCVCRAVL